MTRNAESILSEAMLLSKEERGELAERLMESVHTEPVELTPPWQEEICRRLAEIDSDPSSAISAEEVFESIRIMLETRRGESKP